MIPIIGKRHDLGDGFVVARILPQAARRSIGPFVFFDYFGPVDFPPGMGVDVRPHPHIGLATVTYLFEGAQMHRDTLGSVQEITPGAVNWMTAGRGIAHSERTGPDLRARGHRLHGIQTWVGLPQKDQEAEPGFQHFAADALPERNEKGVLLRMITGEAFGLASPVKVFSPIFYAEARFEPGGSFTVTPDHEERALFIVEGELQIGGENGVDTHGPGAMLFLEKNETVTLFGNGDARVMLLGGAPLDGPRHIWWNFVSSSRERIEQAKADWRSGRFGTIPGDDQEFIPLPNGRD
ncbi:MAG TPA: pirin family protein [Rhizomicrobium sp.]|nr:pirin family protein [Rhizomicrobium sp.]